MIKFLIKTGLGIGSIYFSFYLFDLIPTLEKSWWLSATGFIVIVVTLVLNVMMIENWVFGD